MATLLPVGHPWRDSAPTTPGVVQPVGVWPGIFSGIIASTPPFSGKFGDFLTFKYGVGGASPGGGLQSYGSGNNSAGKITIPVSGLYKIVLRAGLVLAPTTQYDGQLSIAIDQIFVQTPPAVGGSPFVQNCTKVLPGFDPYTWYAPILAGVHQLEVRTYGGAGEFYVDTISMELFREGLAVEPPGARDVTLQPMSSHHISNTAIGSGAVWSAPTDADNAALITGSYGIINSEPWSIPFFTAYSDSPLQTWHSGDTAYVPHDDVSIRMLPGMVVAGPSSPDGDHSIAMFGADRRFMYSGFSAVVNQAPTQPGVSLGRDQISDMFNGLNHATGQGAGQIPGLIRGWEVAAGAIKHMLLFGLPAQLTSPVGTPWTAPTVTTIGYTNGAIFPAWETDYNGAFGQYGSSFAITNVANNGSGLIRITLTSGTQYTGQLVTGRKVKISGVGGVTAANGEWTITVINNTTFDLQGSTFSGSYTSGGTSLATGIQYGSTFGIPSTVDITSLGLSAGGLILARCLQDYGGTHQIQSGAPNAQITLYHEVDTSLDAVLLGQMQTDWSATLIPYLRIMRNQGPLTINGGGTRRQPILPGVSIPAARPTP